MFRLKQLKILRTSYELREQEVYGSNEDWQVGYVKFGLF
jgi:hypothetical protein